MENLNYLQIVLEGYQDINTRNFLKNYFIRKWKKAEENHYSVDEFFVGLRSVITMFEEDIKTRKAKRANELYTLITMNKGDEAKVKEFKDEIQWMRENDSFYAYINGYGNLTGTEVLFIRNAILLAYGDCIPIEKSTNEKTLPKFEDYFLIDVKDIEGLKEYLKTFEGKGKKLACAIHILTKKNIIKSVKTRRKEFVTSYQFINRLEGVNECFEQNSNNLKTIPETDDDLQNVEKEILKYI